MPSQSLISKYAKLVSNPCHGPLERGITDSGIGQVLERVRSSIIPIDAANCANGYVIWFPSYHNSGAVGALGNFYFWNNSDSSLKPTNTIAVPMGSGPSNTAGTFIRDPAFPLVTGASTSFSRARTVSACLQLEYIGALNATSGQVAIISNISLQAFNANGGVSADFVPLSVDQMFSYAGTRERVQITGHEVVWRPDDETSVFRTDGSANNIGAAVPAALIYRPDVVFDMGLIASTATANVCVDNAFTKGICIAWRGFPATANTVSVQAVKVVDLELSTINNAVEPQYATTKVHIPDPVSTVTNWLDRYTPGWQVRAMNMAHETVGALAQSYAPRLLGGNVGRGVRGRMLLHDEP